MDWKILSSDGKNFLWKCCYAENSLQEYYEANSIEWLVFLFQNYETKIDDKHLDILKHLGRTNLYKNSNPYDCWLSSDYWQVYIIDFGSVNLNRIFGSENKHSKIQASLLKWIVEKAMKGTILSFIKYQFESTQIIFHILSWC